MASTESTLTELLALAARVGIKGFTPTDTDANAAPKPAAEHSDPEVQELRALAAQLGIKGFADDDGADA